MLAVFEEEGQKAPIIALKHQIESIIHTVDPEVKIGVKVVSVQNGETLFEKNDTEKFIPGGAVKLMTAAAALKVLGPTFCFETKLFTDGEVKNGKLLGNLYMVGSGDPSFTGHSLEDLIFQLYLNNITEIEGDLVFDASEFDELPLSPGWMWDQKIKCRRAFIDALTMNHSCMTVWVAPAFNENDPPSVRIDPEISEFAIENRASMSSKKSTHSITVGKKKVKGKDVITIDGVMPMTCAPQSFQLAVNSPMLHTATELTLKLKNNKIKHKGKVRFGKSPLDAQVLAIHRSDFLFNLVMYMLKNNDDLYANCFFKKMGRHEFGKPGTWSNGGQSLKEFLSSLRANAFQDLVILDGSGESRENKVTPHQMTSFLQEIHTKFAFSPELIASMPLAGFDGPLKKRLTEGRFLGKIRAQPGALKGVSSLCGFITTRDKEVLAFSVISNGNGKNIKELKYKLEDQISRALAQFSRKG